MNLAELALQRADDAGHVLAVVASDHALTYQQLAAESERVACGLRELGLRRGDRVMMFAENSVEQLVTYLAAARLGAVYTPIHPSFQVSELEYVLANAEPSVIIADSALWDRLERTDGQRLPAARVVVGESRRGLIGYDQLGRNATGSVGIEPVDDQDPVLICYTSGTTDRPHPVTRSHACEIWNARMYAEVWDYRPGDRALIALPLSWVWGLSTLGQGLLATGATIVLHTDFDAEDVLAEIERSRITLFAGTMSMYTAILRALDTRDYDLSSLRRLYRGGEPINDETVRSLQARLGTKLIDAYATTEAAPVLAVDPAKDHDAPSGTVGRLVRDARIRIVDEHGNDVTPGAVGEAWLGGPGLMLRYWNEPQLTAERLTPDGWFRSGDLLREGRDGYYFIIGRTADIIIRNGAKIAPAEVESALATVAGVADSIAVGVPDVDFGESIVAYVQLVPGCIVSADDVYDHLSDRIARFKLPSHIEFVEQLPIRRNEKRDRTSMLLRALNDVDLRATGTTGADSDGTDASAAAVDAHLAAHLRVVE